MKEITELANQLAKMGILRAKLDVDIQRLMEYRDQVNKAFDTSAMIFDSKSQTGITPGFTIQIYGVKLYFNDPKIYIEKA